jgi:cytochrome c oxidase cbb3-type subunit 4
MNLDQETLLTIQGYGKFFVTLFVFVIFYSYAYSIYKRQRTGERDFEKYSDLVHNDSIESKPLESNKSKSE